MKAILSLCFFVFLIGFNSISAQISANFSALDTEACGSLQTTFFDQSTSDQSIISWSWNLGGNTSSKQNPGAIFTEPGSYTICLTVTDIDGNTDTECKEDYITILSNPIALFESDITEGCAPFQVTFTDLSTTENGSIVSWLWGIGGSTGVLNTQNSDEIVTSTYAVGGEYTASLTIEDSLGCTSTTTIPNFIDVYQIPTPDISSDLISSCQLPWIIQFTNENSDPSVDYFWDFGNGTTFQGLTPPSVSYTDVGKYNLTLYMSSGDCADTLVLEEFIDTDATAKFTYSPQTACQGAPIEFLDESVISADSVVWNFGDGTESFEKNPLHAYSDAGCYDVTLIRFAEECSDTTVLSCIEVNPTPSVEIEIVNQFNCSLPTTLSLQSNSESSGSVLWEFQDGTDITSADSNNVPIFIEEFGSYLVDFTFTDSLGCAFEEKSIPVDIYPFEVLLPELGPSGCAPLDFTLTDSIISQVDIAEWSWSINNGLYTSFSSIPTFTIPDTGRYDVQLIATNANGCIDTVLIEDYVKVGMKPEVNFEATPLESCTEDAVQFTDLSSDFADEWFWVFGDFTASEEQNPFISLVDPGVHDVTLIASQNGCADSLRIEDYISILSPRSNYSIAYNCEDPYSVEINNQSVGADSLFWTLRLSESDSLIINDSILGSFTLPDRGVYTLSHYSKNFETGCEHTFTDTIKIVDPIASYTMDTLRGCAPLEVQLGDFSQDAFQYEYLADDGVIDSIFNSEPIIIFEEGGIINGPLLIITDIHECKDSFQLMDSVVVNKLDAAALFPEVICVPDDAEFIDQSIDVLGEVIKWEWEIGNGAFTSSKQDTTILFDSTGVYDVYLRVEDDWGCIDSLYLPAAINAVEIVPNFTSDTLGCTTAAISFSALGQNGFVEYYNWDFGDGNTSDQQNPNHYYTSEGTYSVCLTMGDSRGCEKTVCKENIVSIIDPKADFIGDPIFATCPPLLANLTNLSQDAVAYTWYFGDNSGVSQNESPSHVYTSPGSFDVTLIAQSTSNCFDTLILEDYVRVEGPSGEFVIDLSPTCIPISVDLYAQSDGFYSYTWDYGNGVLDSVSGLVIVDTTSYIYTETGTFTPKLIITDSIGCSRSFAGDPIHVNDVDLEFIKDTEPLCGPPLEVFLTNNSTGTTEDVDYTWLLEGPEILNSNEKSPLFTISETGFYNVHLIAQYDNCLDTLTEVDFLEIADIPNIAFELLTEEFCEDVNAEFLNTSTIGYGEITEWIWDFGDGNTSDERDPVHQFSGLESRTITLIGITDKGCQSEYSATFDVLPSMVGNAGEDALICIGDEVQLDASIDNLIDGGTYYWEGAFLSCSECFNPLVNPEITSQYTFVSIHPNGCESRDTILVTVIPTPGPELSLSSDSIICLGTESTILVDNFNSNYNYIWNNEIAGQDCYVDCEEVTISPDTFTTYYVTVFNEFGCFKEDSVHIDVETAFVEFVPPVRAICEGESTTLEVIAGNNPQWYPDNDISCLTCPEIIVSPEANKKYYLTVKSDLGCEYSDSIQVIVVPEGSVFAGIDQEICRGESISLSGSGIGQPQWNPSQIVIDTGAFTTSAFPDTSGYISLTMSYDECSQSDSFYVEVYTQAEISAIGDSICPGGIGILTVDGRADAYLWLDQDGINQESNSFELSADKSKLVNVVGYYRTCKPDTAQALLHVFPEIDYNLIEDRYTLFLNDEVSVQSSVGSIGNYSYSWTPEEGLDCFDCPNPIISGITEDTEYTLEVVDLDSECYESFQVSVRFQNECTQNVFHVPNIISTKGNPANGSFRVSTKNPEEFISLSIFDRWGSIVFNTSDINESWNGTYGSRFVASGVYVYRIELICPYTNENYIILGDVTVIH